VTCQSRDGKHPRQVQGFTKPTRAELNLATQWLSDPGKELSEPGKGEGGKAGPKEEV